jgi:hypothetical protein
MQFNRDHSHDHRQLPSTATPHTLQPKMEKPLFAQSFTQSVQSGLFRGVDTFRIQAESPSQSWFDLWALPSENGACSQDSLDLVWRLDRGLCWACLHIHGCCR